MKDIYRKGLLHHHYRFGLKGNIKVWFCRTFGHKLNDNKDHEWCDRCGLAHSEIYHKQIKNETIVIMSEFLNKTEAIEAMIQGNKITHGSFTDDEWMTMKNGKIITEDGYSHSPDEFWKYRQLPSWNYYYSIKQ